MNITYQCTGCNNKTTDTSSLIKRNSGGCRSCGKSNYKCPRCGMVMKAYKNPIANNQTQARSYIETGVKLKSSPVSGSIESPTRMNIKRLK